MLFQTLDSKEECVGSYVNGELHFDTLPNNLTHTWGWAHYLPDNIEYAQIYCNGQSLDEVCPSHLKDKWDRVNSQLKAFFRSFSLAKIDMSEICFFDLVQKSFLEEHSEIKNSICQWVFENYERPEIHDHIIEIQKVLRKISHRQLNIDYALVTKEAYRQKVRNFQKKLGNYKTSIDYSVFGAVTGRLTTSRRSFPILRFEKEMRHFLKPNHDWFVEFDYNAADLRSLFFILDKPQPQMDIHDWNIQNVFGSHVQREDAKRLIFSWLYDLNKKDQKLEKAYGRDHILKTCWDGKQIVNPFGRRVACDQDHAISYLIQSTTADYVLNKMVKVSKMLEGMKSEVAFSIHDSVIVDMDWEERHIIGDILSIMREDGFVSSVHTGKDFGNMKELKI